jgi:fatty-acyl-CoA synthase
VSDRFEIHDFGAITSRNARRTPDRLAYVTPTGALTWHDVDEAAKRLANALAGRGVGQGDRVAILGAPDLGWPVAQFAVWKLGAAVMAVHSMLLDDALVEQLVQARAAALLAGPEYAARARDLAARASLRAVATWGEAVDGVASFDELTSGTAATEPDVVVAPGDVSLLLYSSGTTGTPKGIVHSFQTLLSSFMFQVSGRSLHELDVGLTAVPLFTFGGQGTSFMPYGMLGMTSVHLTKFDPVEAVKVIDEHDVSVMFAVPTMTRALLGAAGGFALTSLRQIMSAGAPMTIDLLKDLQEKLPNVAVTEMYGLSEMATGLLIDQRQRSEARLGSVGIPGLGTDMRIADDNDQAVPPHNRGEIHLRGTGRFLEYFERPDLTEAAITPDGWLRTGDIGIVDEEGFCWIVDRKKDIVISGGTNVYPKETEEVLQELDGVLECAVFGVPDEKWGEAVVATVVLAPGSSLDEIVILAHARARLARYQVPKRVLFVPEIPKTATGKLDKNQLRAPFWVGTGRSI